MPPDSPSDISATDCGGAAAYDKAACGVESAACGGQGAVATAPAELGANEKVELYWLRARVAQLEKTMREVGLVPPTPTTFGA